MQFGFRKNHSTEIKKLSKLNISPTVIQWLKSYLDNGKQCVKVNNNASAIINHLISVPQGSTLGPLLFTLYSNDLPDMILSSATCQMYAEDPVIYFHSNTKIQAAKELSSAMVFIQNWLNNTFLHLNLEKTVCMYFTKSQNTEQTYI